MLEKGVVFTGKWFTGRVEVMSVNEEDNILHVYLTSEEGYSWEEDWNLGHTRTGFEHGDYFFNTCTTCNGSGEITVDNVVIICTECNGDLHSKMLNFGEKKIKPVKDDFYTKMFGDLQDQINDIKVKDDFYTKMFGDLQDQINDFKLEPYIIEEPYYLNTMGYNKPLKRGHYENIRTEPKIGRNEPCTCGSGKKNKKCCNK